MTAPQLGQSPVLRGAQVLIRPFEPSDAEFLRDVSNDLVYQAAAFQAPSLPRGVVPFRRRLEEGHQAPLTGAYGAVELAIAVDEGGGDPIGVAGLYQIDWQNRQAEMGVSITDPAHRGMGLGLDANATMLDYAFDHLAFHRIYGHVKADNAAPLRVCGRLGFVVEGRLREHRQRGDSRVDLCIVGLLRREWLKSEYSNRQGLPPRS